jgi:putative ABC transport system permease protein
MSFYRMMWFHIRTALRQILQFKRHTAFSLTGLVLGLTCVLIIFAWSMQELRFDRFHDRAGDIYMVTTDIRDQTGNVIRYPETPAPLADELDLQIPRIEHAFHFLYLYGGRELKAGEHTFKEDGIAATPEFLEVLNFRLLSGDARALDDPNSIFLSQDLANKLFPEGHPVNRELLYKDDRPLVVKGVFKNVPVNSSLQFDFLIPYEIEYGISDEWWQLSDATFIRTSHGTEMDKVHALMKQLWREHITDDQYDIGLISIADLRYGADFEFFNAAHGHGNRKKLFMFMGIAFLILLLACLNYLILISAHTVLRKKEIWIRKIQGASAGDISASYVLESIAISILAWGLAALLSLLGLRAYETLVGIDIAPGNLRFCIILGLPASILLAGLASGFFPAIRAGSRTLVPSNETGRPDITSQRKLMSVFMVSQFVLSVGLVISSLIIIRQADYMRKFKTGYTTERIVGFNFPQTNDSLLYEIRNLLTSQPDVACFSFAGSSPVSLTVLSSTEKWEWEGLEAGSYTSIYRISVDEGYLDVFQIPLVEGRFFSEQDKNQDRVVINQTLAGMMDLENPIGYRLRRGDREYEIIGMVRDFHFQHLSSEIRPFLFFNGGSNRYLYVRFTSAASSGTSELLPMLSAYFDEPVTYDYISEAREQMYRGEMQILTAVLFFAVLCILMSNLGLIGIVSQDTASREKEIAVRKVLGAETRGIIISLNLNLLKMFLPGIFLGGFLAWYIMRRWLENYAYRTGMGGWVFVLGPVIILTVALLSAGFQTWKVSRRSPVLALEYQ